MRGQIAFLVVLVVLGVCLRWAQTARNFVVSPDGTEYLATAVGFEREGGAALKVGLRQPLYPLGLWGAGRVAEGVWEGFSWRSDEMVEVGRVLGIVLYVPFLLAAWFFLRKLLGGLWALAGMFIIIVHPIFGMSFANVLSETLYLTFLALGLGSLAEAVEPERGGRGAYAWAVGAGVCAGLAYLTRVEGQVLVLAALVCVVLVRSGRGGQRWGERAGAAACSMGGFLLAALPVMVYLGETSRRYSWEWLWERLALLGAGGAGGGVATAGLDPAASPARSMWMLVQATLKEAPALSVAAVVVGILWFVRKRREGERAEGASRRRAVLVTMGLYAAAIVAGVSIQNGVVSGRYVQPLVLLGLPLVLWGVAAVFGEKIEREEGKRGRLAVAVAAAAVIYGMAAAEACGHWESYKGGYRDAGVAVREAGCGRGLVTSSARLAYYAESGRCAVSVERLREEICGGGGGNECVAIETKRFDEGEMVKLRGELLEAGFGEEAWLDFAEGGGNGAERRILVFRREDGVAGSGQGEGKTPAQGGR